MNAMTLSYAQRLEDYHLSSAFGNQASGFYVDLGAGHPVADNVSYWFYLQGWRGVVVEPQAHLLDLYRHLRPRDVAVCSLIGQTVGEADFHIVEGLHGLSTMLELNARKAAAHGASYTTVRRPVTTLAQLLEVHRVGSIDFLKVDVEGAEPEVFAGADWSRWRPRMIVAEAIAPNTPRDASQDWEAILLDQGYVVALFDGLNRFYVAEEEAALRARLPSEPARWDAVRHLYEFGRAPENPDHPDHTLAHHLVSVLLADLPSWDEDDLVMLLLRDFNSLNDRSGFDRFHVTPSEPEVSRQELCRALVRSDVFRAALGRIAAPYDGGLTLDDPQTPVR